MRLDVSLQQRLSQQLRLAPQIIQSIEISSSAMDLKELIENELQENEMLEGGGPSRLPPRAAASASTRRDGRGRRGVFERSRASSEADRSAGAFRAPGERGTDRKWEGSEQPRRGEPRGAPRGSSLDVLSSGRRAPRPAEAIVYNLADGGLLRATSRRSSPGWTTRVPGGDGPALAVQGLEPAGVGARDSRMLLLQVRDDEPDADLKRRLLREHLDDLERNKIPRIAKALGVTVERCTSSATACAT